MNREVLFRGKCVSDSKYAGEWVTGGYVAPDADCKRRNEGLIVEYFGGNTTITYHVDPDTVGQFTGFLDKNGKKIFEGDVIRCGMRLYVCEFIEGGFEFRDMSDGKLVLKAIVNHSCLIGNIHDNQLLDDK